LHPVALTAPRPQWLLDCIDSGRLTAVLSEWLKKRQAKITRSIALN